MSDLTGAVLPAGRLVTTLTPSRGLEGVVGTKGTVTGTLTRGQTLSGAAASSRTVTGIITSSGALGAEVATGGGEVCTRIRYDTTAGWNAQPGLISRRGVVYVYSDHATEDGQTIPGIKIGDGNAYLIDLPFSTRYHTPEEYVSAEDRLAWDGKIRVFLDENDTETLVFTTERG